MLQNSAEVKLKTVFFISGIKSNWIFLLGMKEYWCKNKICVFQLQNFLPFFSIDAKLGLRKMYEVYWMICYVKQFS